MTRSRATKLLVVLAVVVSSASAVGTTVGAEGTDFQISNVSVTPSDPSPGERATVETTIENLESSEGVVTVTDVYLRTAGGTDEHGRIEDVGSFEPGQSVTLPMSVTFDDPGQRSLVVTVVVADDDGHHAYEYPTVVSVEEPDEALLSFPSTEATTGGAAPVDVSVANGHSEEITGVQLTLDGTATVANPERIVATLEPGEEETFQYDVAFDEVGTRTLTGEVSYKTLEGFARTVTKSVSMDVTEPTVDVGLSTGVPENRSGSTEVAVRNFGNTVLTDVELRANGDGNVLDRKLLPDIPAESSRSAVLETSGTAAGRVTYGATYHAAGEEHTTSITERNVAGEIRLTGVETSGIGGRVTIQGEAANVGSSDAESVLVRIPDGESVGPASPSGEYFVGPVEASQFATFELTGETEPNASSIPVETTYIVDGERVTTTHTVAVDSTSASAPAGGPQAMDGVGPQGPGGPDGPGAAGGPGGPGGMADPGGSDGLLDGLPAIVWIGLVVVVAAVGVGVYRRRKA